MAVEDKFADEMLTDDELDQVAGGTYEEWKEIVKFFPYGSGGGGGSSYGSGGGFSRSYTTYRSDDWIKDWIKRNLNIDVEFDATSYWIFYQAGPNTYTRNGESLTHEQVVKEIRAIRGDY